MITTYNCPNCGAEILVSKTKPDFLPLSRFTCPGCGQLVRWYDLEIRAKARFVGEGAGAPGVNVIPKGTAVSSTTSVTLTGVKIGVGSALYVTVGSIFESSLVGGQASCSHGATSLGIITIIGTTSTSIQTFFLRPADATAGIAATVSASIPDAAIKGMTLIVSEVTGLNNSYTPTEFNEAITPSASPNAVMTSDPFGHPAGVVMASVITETDSSPLGTWHNGFTAGQDVIGTGTSSSGGITGYRLSEAYNIRGPGEGTGGIPISKSFGQNVDWAMISTNLRSSW